jgi:hypothetical protein
VTHSKAPVLFHLVIIKKNRYRGLADATRVDKI